MMLLIEVISNFQIRAESRKSNQASIASVVAIVIQSR